MDVITGIVADLHLHGHSIGIEFAADDGRTRSLVAPNEDGLLIASLNGALAHGDRIALHFERIMPRLGAPLGRAVRVEVINYEAEMGHAA